MNFYNDQHYEHGDDVKSLGWSTEVSQYIRFSILCDRLDYDSYIYTNRILDVGCGFGDLFVHLRQRLAWLSSDDETPFEYTGIDTYEKFIATAKERYKEYNRRSWENNEFKLMDIIDLPENDRYDFILISGTFNIKQPDIDKYTFLTNTINRLMNNNVVKQLRFNFLAHAPNLELKEYHAVYDPLEIMRWLNKLGHKYTIRHDYMPHDYTVYLKKTKYD